MNEHKYDRFGLEFAPFGGRPEKPYLDQARMEVVERLGNFIHRRGFAVLHGPPGTGKTMLLGHVCSKLNTRGHRVVYAPFSTLKPPDMLRFVCSKLDLQPAMSTSRMLAAIQDRVASLRPVNLVLVLDEIQKISHETLEMVRTMANFNFEERSVISVVMAGGDEFIQRLALRINEPMAQRITCFLKLGNMSRQGTAEFVEHQFQAAGAHHAVTTPEAVNLAFEITSGNPRTLSSLMGAALDNAANAGDDAIDIPHVKSAAQMVFPGKQEAIQ